MPKIGFRFHPTEQELLDYFLSNKITENQVLDEDDDYPVKVRDLYGDVEPWDLWNFYGGKTLLKDESLYFFTRLKKLSPTGSRFNRKIGSGAWQGEDRAKAIAGLDDSEKILGFKKRFRYENSNNTQENGRWIMYEYTINPLLLCGECSYKALDYVLCCVTKNESGQQKEKSGLGKKQTKWKQIGERNEYGQRALGRKRKLKQSATPTNDDQTRHLKAEEEAILIQPAELPYANNVLQVVESETETERYSYTLYVEDLFSDINPSSEAESSSLTFNVEELFSQLDQRAKDNCIGCPLNVDQSIQSKQLRAEEEEALVQAVECEVEKQRQPEDSYESFYSTKMDQVLGRVLNNVSMETLEQWVY